MRAMEAIHKWLEAGKRTFDFQAGSRSVDEFLERTEGDVHLTHEHGPHWPAILDFLSGEPYKHRVTVKLSARAKRPTFGIRPFLFHELEPRFVEIDDLFDGEERRARIRTALKSAEYWMKSIAYDIEQNGRNVIVHAGGHPG